MSERPSRSPTPHRQPSQRRYAHVTDVALLIAQLQEANERLIISGVQAQSASDDANAQISEARAEVARLIDCLQKATAEIHEREEDYRQLSGQLLEVQDQERRQLARDLHDSTAQHLAALLLNLDLIERDVGHDVRVRGTLADSQFLAGQCVREMRTLSYLLHPPLLDDLGVAPAIRSFVAGFVERSGIQVDLDVEEIDRLPAPMEIALYRVVQESLTNVQRHARDSIASVHLGSTPRTIVLEVRNRSRHLQSDLQERTRQPVRLGVGILGMRERIIQLDGAFDVSFTHVGTTVRVRVTRPKRST